MLTLSGLKFINPTCVYPSFNDINRLEETGTVFCITSSRLIFIRFGYTTSTKLNLYEDGNTTLLGFFAK